MMYRRLLAVTTACCLPALSAQTDDVARLKAMLEDISTLSADVVQLIMESDGGVLEESSIRMQLKRPNGFYWETLEPFPELIVTNGIKLWNYQPDLEQVVVEDWDSSRSELAAQLLSGQTDNLAQEYSIELVSDPDQALQEFQLTPKASDSIYSRISISYVDGRIDLIHLDSKNGEQTVWQFNNTELNLSLADELFEFEPPAGIEVIENTYSQ